MPSSHVHDTYGSIYGLFFFVCQTVGEGQLVWATEKMRLQVIAYQPGGRAERSQ